MIISRNLKSLLSKTRKSFLLLGPRQTGKSTLIKELGPEVEINLADEQTYLDFVRNPREIYQRLSDLQASNIFIDEIQRLPSLLNTLQVILDEQKMMRFYLTGSSARKLRRGHANLLPGRLHTYFLGPLCASELEYNLRTLCAMEIGTLPAIYTEESTDEALKTLRSYSVTYVKEEIQAEALTKNLEGFSRFLFVVAGYSGQFLDLTKLARDAQIPRQSAARYFEILEDTLIINRCEAFAKTDLKRLIQHPKYYFFDNGVLNALLGNFKASDDRKGILFEHLFFNQLLASAYSRDKEIQISTYRTEHGAEVDFIIQLEGEVWAVELKASSHVGREDLRGLRNFSEFYRKKHHSLLAYWGETEKNIEGVSVLPWQKALKRIGL